MTAFPLRSADSDGVDQIRAHVRSGVLSSGWLPRREAGRGVWSYGARILIGTAWMQCGADWDAFWVYFDCGMNVRVGSPGLTWLCSLETTP